MKHLLTLTSLISLSVSATCWQSPETVCFKNKDLDLKMSYTIVSCSPPGGPVNHSSTMIISSLSDPNKKLNIKRPKYLRNVLQQQELMGVVNLQSVNDLNSLIIIQKDINEYNVTLISDLYPELNTRVGAKLDDYKCDRVMLKWGTTGQRRDRSILRRELK